MVEHHGVKDAAFRAAIGSRSSVVLLGIIAGLVLAPGCIPAAAESDAGTPPEDTLDSGAADAPFDDGLDEGTDGPEADVAADADALDVHKDDGTDAGPVLPPCPTYDPGNPRHHAYGQESATTIIRADETWKSDDVYFVISLFEIKGATLTIEAGTRVCLAAGGGSPPTISVSGEGTTEGRVLINGTAARPVVFDRATKDDQYTGFYFSGPSDARFDHVRFIGGGIGGLGVLRFGFNHARPAVLRNVHIESFFKGGLNVQNPLGLSADSTVYLDSQQSTSTEPIAVASLEAAKTLTPSTLHISPTIPDTTRLIRFLDGNVRSDLTLSGTIGADYLVGSGDLIVRRPDSTAPIPTLTLEAGARLRFGDGELIVGNVGSGSEGSLAVNGTTANPAVLTSKTTPAARGQWNGVTLYVGALGPTTALRNLRIENAGGGGGANINNCRAGAGVLGLVSGALKLRPILGGTASYAGPTLAGVEIVRSGGDGVAFTCTPSGCLTTDYGAVVTGSDNAGPLLRPLGCP